MPAERPAGERPHVVLVGLPGAGKSTVGPLVAAALGRPFVDLDAELERRVGASVAEQFAGEGEPAFRRREAELSAELARGGGAVLAPGGGWLANAVAAATLRPLGVLIYLLVRPADAIARLGEGRATRPLLAGPDPLGALEALYARRRALYEEADATVDALGAPAAVAARVVAVVRGRSDERTAAATDGELVTAREVRDADG